ncbi:homeobox and c2h2 transcription [Stemphylium lycopersici]|nr:homeobox and c2h2 transcription [Stemphylium lycopersici]
MEDNLDIPEESMRHIEALLARHPPQIIQRMFSQALDSRRNSTASSFMSTSTASSSATSSSGSSWRSRLSIASSFSSSTSNSNRAPSIASSSSSRSKAKRPEPRSYPAGLDPTRPAPATMPSETDSPLELKTEPNCTPTDELSVASPALFPDDDKSQSQSGESYMFCTYCAEQKNQKTFKAKSDWKKHEMRMHETGEDWPCIVNGCNRIFDRQKDFIKHHQRYHAGRPLPSLTDIGITLLPRRVFGCGFDKCKEVSIGWDERCDHVAKHMKNGATMDQWKYSNVIRNLIRQEALHDTWKELIACLDERLRESRSQISWCPDNSRILRQKLQCCDLRPSREEVLITALSLRADVPLDPVHQQLPPGFVTPSRDSVPHVEKLSREQRMHILIGNSNPHLARSRLAAINAALLRTSSTMSHVPDYDCGSSPFVEPQTPAVDTTNRRISYMDVDPGDYLDVAQPAIPDLPPVMSTATMHPPHPQPPILDHEQQAQMYSNEYIEHVKAPPNPLESLYPNYFGAPPQFEESQYYDRPSFGQMISKPLHKIGNRLSGSRSSSAHSRPPSHMNQSLTDMNSDYAVAAMGMRPPSQQQQQQQPHPHMQQNPHQQHHPQHHMMQQHPQPQSYRDSSSQIQDHLHMYATQN